jgi:uncharacterized protein (DUF2384 family)
MEQATTTLLENGQVRVRVGEAEGTFVVHGKRLVPLSQEQVYRDLEQVWDHLRGLVQETEAERWLYAPNPTLDGASPRDLIEQGETERVLELIATVEHGIYS